MKNSKLLTLYLTLEETTKKRFVDFVSSPYYNTNENISGLLEYIGLFSPSYDQVEFTKENAYQFVYQDDKEAVVSRIIKLSSKLQKLLEQFIAVEQINTSTFSKDYQMLLHYGKSGIENEFFNTYKRINKEIAKEEISPKSFHNQFLIEKEYNRFISTRKDEGIGDVHFGSTIKALDLYYLMNKLVYECQRINRKSIIKGWEEEQANFLDLDKIQNSEYMEVPIIKVWYEAYQLLKGKDDKEHYIQLKKYLLDDSYVLPISQKRLLFTYLENKAIRLFPDRQKMYEELFSLYDYQNGKNILFDDEFSVANVIRNFVTVVLKIGKIAEAEAFIQQVVKQQKKGDYEEVLNLSRAYITFEKKFYELVLDTLNVSKTSNLYFKIEERRLRVKSYYHLDMDDLNFDLLISFRVFLSDNKEKINEYHLSANRNFISILLRFLKSKSDFKLDAPEILEELSTMSPIVDKEWLTDVISVSI